MLSKIWEILKNIKIVSVIGNFFIFITFFWLNTRPVLYQLLMKGWGIFSGLKSPVYMGLTTRVLITGGLGQLDTGLAREMRKLHREETVILLDIVKPEDQELAKGPFVFADVPARDCSEQED